MSKTLISIGFMFFMSLSVNVCLGFPQMYGLSLPENLTSFPAEERGDESQFPASEGEEGEAPIPDSSGPCPRPLVMEDFQPFKYLGRWYEIERFNAPFQMGDCVTADYGLFPNCSISIVNSNVVEGELESVFAYATADSTVGRLIVHFPESPLPPETEPNYSIVTTDYENYAVVYGCDDLGQGETFEFSWILGRRPELDEDFVIQLKKWLQYTGIGTEKYIKTNQQDCLRRPL